MLIDNAILFFSEKNEDGKSFQNPPNDKLDDSYHQFVAPIESGRRGGKCLST